MKEKFNKIPRQAAPVVRQSTSSAPIADGSGVEASGWFDDLAESIGSIGRYRK